MSEFIIDWDTNLIIDTFSKNTLREQIVRCKDCVYRGWSDAGGHFCSRGIGLTVEPDGFCAWGERREHA